MIVGIGTDLVEVGRISALLARHGERAASRLFTGAEIGHCNESRAPDESLAARFAAKEALFKALGTGWSGGASWQEVEIVPESSGAPRLVLHGVTKSLADSLGVRRIHVSLTHTKRLAAAYVVLEG